MTWRSFALALATMVVGMPAFGQTYDLLVTTGDMYGLETSAFEDIVEESAWLAQDFGGFTVSRWYQLEAEVGPGMARAVLGCGSDSSCYVDALFDSRYDYVLVVSASFEGADIRVDYQMIDTRVGIRAAQTTAWMPTETDFAYLLVPCHDALKVTPAWIEPPPVASVPVTPPPTAYAEPRPRRELGQLGRIGAYTAGGGAALFIGGVLLGFGADETQQEIQAEPHEQRQLESLQSKGQRQQRMANAFFGLGGAALAGGVTLLIVDRVKDDDAGIAMGTDGRSLWVRAEF